jgi:hypothetical protein
VTEVIADLTEKLRRFGGKSSLHFHDRRQTCAGRSQRNRIRKTEGRNASTVMGGESCARRLGEFETVRFNCAT